jgi:hypothetical protein
MTQHAYPPRALIGDYARAAAGATLTGAPLFLAGPGTVLTVILGSLFTLFCAYALRTVARQRTRITLTDDGIASQGLTLSAIRWSELEQVRLSYFSTRRDRSKGWMSLNLRGSGHKLEIDSSITDFNAIAERAARAGDANGVAFDQTTLENFRSLNIRFGEDGV